MVVKFAEDEFMLNAGELTCESERRLYAIRWLLNYGREKENWGPLALLLCRTPNHRRPDCQAGCLCDGTSAVCFALRRYRNPPGGAWQVKTRHPYG